MKKLLTRFASGLLSREQMRKVKGGYEGTTCTLHCTATADGITVDSCARESVVGCCDDLTLSTCSCS